MGLSCAGLVSLTLLSSLLTGPPHRHQQQPARAHFVGDTSPQVYGFLLAEC